MNVEELIGADAYPNVLRGGNAGERLISGSSKDTLDGRRGSDALYGGADDDLLHGGAGNDHLDGGPGIDTALWAFAAPGTGRGEIESGSFGHLDVDLMAGSAIFRLFSGGQENDTLTSVENIIGGDGDDRFVIGFGDMTIDGGDGDDTLDFGTFKGTIRIDTAAGTFEAELEVDQPVWSSDSGTTPRSKDGLQLTPQGVLKADATFANSTGDLARAPVVKDTADSDVDLEIDFVTGTQSVRGTFTSIEQFVAGAARLTGSAADDHFFGSDGINVFEGGRGNDTLDGAGGSDTAVFSNPIGSYVITGSSSGLDVVDTSGEDGRDTLINIERLRFSDKGIAYDLDASAGQVAKVIGAVIGREHVSNPGFVGIGLELMNDGTTDGELAEFAISAMGVSTPSEIFTLLWNNVVGAPPTAQQAQSYVDMLNDGVLTMGELGVFAAETDLNAANIDLTGLSAAGIEFV